MESKLLTLLFFFLAVVTGMTAKEAAVTNALPLTVSLKQQETKALNVNRFEVSIKNSGKSDIVIIKPLDGSQWSWYLPFYQFHVSDSSGKKLELPTRCGIAGLWSDTKWPDDYVMVLKPGSEFKKILPLNVNIQEEGVYQVSFSYVMDTKKYRLKGQVLDYPENAWQGTASSPVKKYMLKSHSRDRKKP